MSDLSQLHAGIVEALYQCRAAAQHHYGRKYWQKVEAWKRRIRAQMDKMKTKNEVVAAEALYKQGDRFVKKSRAILFAAVVEMVDSTHNPQVGAGVN